MSRGLPECCRVLVEPRTPDLASRRTDWRCKCLRPVVRDESSKGVGCPGAFGRAGRRRSALRISQILLFLFVGVATKHRKEAVFGDVWLAGARKQVALTVEDRLAISARRFNCFSFFRGACLPGVVCAKATTRLA